MTYEEYIERVRALGYNTHFNDGVWWIEKEPFYYEPVIPYQVLDCGTARPKIQKALLGYQHIVSNEKYAIKYHPIMLLNEEQLKDYGMHSLTRNRRKKIKKGLRLNDVRKIDSIETVIDDMKELLMSKAARTGKGKPPEYYINHYEEWKEWQIQQFNGDKGKKEYWGAFYDGSMIAFMTIFQINDTMTLSQAASHTDHLDKNPNDAIRFSVLDYCRNLKDCKKVVSGTWSVDKPSLNEYKQSYGFKRVDLPVFVKYNLNILPMFKKIIEIKQLRKLKKSIMSYLIHRKK